MNVHDRYDVHRLHYLRVHRPTSTSQQFPSYGRCVSYCCSFRHRTRHHICLSLDVCRSQVIDVQSDRLCHRSKICGTRSDDKWEETLQSHRCTCACTSCKQDAQNELRDSCIVRHHVHSVPMWGRGCLPCSWDCGVCTGMRSSVRSPRCFIFETHASAQSVRAEKRFFGCYSGACTSGDGTVLWGPRSVDHLVYTRTSLNICVHVHTYYWIRWKSHAHVSLRALTMQQLNRCTKCSHQALSSSLTWLYVYLINFPYLQLHVYSSFPSITSLLSF